MRRAEKGPIPRIGFVSQNRQYQDRSIRLRWPAGIDALSVMGKPCQMATDSPLLSCVNTLHYTYFRVK